MRIILIISFIFFGQTSFASKITNLRTGESIDFELDQDNGVTTVIMDDGRQIIIETSKLNHYLSKSLIPPEDICYNSDTRELGVMGCLTLYTLGHGFFQSPAFLLLIPVSIIGDVATLPVKVGILSVRKFKEHKEKEIALAVIDQNSDLHIKNKDFKKIKSILNLIHTKKVPATFLYIKNL